MAYLNANIPPIYCKIRTEYLYDMDMDKKGEKTVLSSVWQVYQDVPYYFMLCCQMARSFIDCLSQRFSKNVLIEPKCPICG
jgi:hypothetical protein